MKRVLWVLVVTGCWTEEPLIDGLFTQTEWDQLQLMTLDKVSPDLCPGMAQAECDAAANLGQQLFFEPALSGPITITTATDPGAFGDSTSDAGKIACFNCHDPKKFFVDPRATNISLGADYTGHNALGLVNTGLKAVRAKQLCDGVESEICNLVFAWNGRYNTPGDVLKIAGLGKAAMHSTRHIIAEVIRNNGSYLVNYTAAFGPPPPDDDSCQSTDEPKDNPVASCADADIFNHVALAFDRYERRLVGGPSPFDAYVSGTVGDDHQTSKRDKLGDEARRGLAVFLHKGLCIDCHSGPLFSDLQFHNTGVPQRGPHLPATDTGLAAGLAAPPLKLDRPQYTGMFLTQPLRNVSRTAPYMHGGQFATLADVIEFYRKGGGVEGFSGIKDSRLEVLEIDDQDAHDLEELLKSLEGLPVPDGLTKPPES